MSRLHGARKHILDLRTIGNDQPIRLAAAKRQIVNADEIIALAWRDEIEERIAAVIIAVGGELFAVGGMERERGVHLGVELAGLTLDHHTLALLRRKTKHIITIAVRRAVDDGI